MGWPAAIAAGGAIASAAGSLWNSISNNSFQKKYAKNQVQWRVEDMRKAGINPVLAANPGFGAGSANLQNADFSGLSNAGQSAATVMQAGTAARQADSNIELQSAHTLNSAADTENKMQMNELIREQARTEATRRMLMAAQAGYSSASTVSERLRQSELQAQKEFYDSDFGKASKKYTETLGKSREALIASVADTLSKNKASSAKQVRRSDSKKSNYNYDSSTFNDY